MLHSKKLDKEEERRSRIFLIISWARIVAEITMIIGFFILVFVLASRF